MEPNIQEINRSAAMANVVVKGLIKAGKFNPAAAVISTQVAVSTQIGTTIVAVQDQTSQAELFDLGYEVDGSILALTAKIEGAILALGVAATGGAAIAGGWIPVTLGALALVVASAANEDVRDIITDPEFVDALTGGLGALDEYFQDKGFSLSDFVDSLLDGFFTGVIPGFGSGLDSEVNDSFSSARNWFQKKDPMTLDLDGDGLETVGIDSSNPILFDHTGDGIANATGWISPDDGFLVHDLNGNGQIDNGTELFGDSTPIFNEAGEVIGKAEDGFDALVQQDTNGDGIVNANDDNWQDLRIWQDTNSNGTTEEGELHTLASLGIAGIEVAKTENSVQLSNGNEIADLGKFIYEDGSEGSLGAVTGGLADINLADNPFFREFADSIPLTAEAGVLPEMQGSGSLRDLQEAASLSPALVPTVSSYAAAATKAAQLAQVDGLITQWANSSDFQTSIEAAAPLGYQLHYLIPGLSASDLVPDHFISSGGGSGSASIGGQDPAEQARIAALIQQQEAITSLIATLEKFNGQTFVNLQSDSIETGAGGSILVTNNERRSYRGTSIGEPAQRVFLSLSSTQIGFLEESYEALRNSVYDGLLMQTRLKTYTDAVNITVTDEAGLELDFSGTEAALQARFDEAPAEAVIDLLDMQRVAGSGLNGLGWDGFTQLRGWLEDAMADPALEAAILPALAEFGYSNLTDSGEGTASSDVVMGDNGGDTLNGNAGNDLILGSDGDDTLNGGTGDDTLYGGSGNDTYTYNSGDGNDTIIETHGDATQETLVDTGTVDEFGDPIFTTVITDLGNDQLLFGEGIRVGNLDIYSDGDALVFANSAGGSLSIANWFNSLSDTAHQLNTLTFANGSPLDLSKLQVGSAEDDTLIGTDANDLLSGGAGDDTLTGEAGDDVLIGGTGIDNLAGGTGNDVYVVDNTNDIVTELDGEGNDTVETRVSYSLSAYVENMVLVGTAAISGFGNTLSNLLTGNSADNTLSGLAGDDTLEGGDGNDTLDGGLGDDVMAGGDGDDSYVVDSLGDTVTEQSGEGIDTVETALTYTLGDNVENLQLTGSDAVDGTGNTLDNTITGNAGDNTLNGLAGNDVLSGGAGDDTLTGGAGNDRLDGGIGTDSLNGGTGNDTYVIDENGDTVTENSGEGSDTVEASITYTLTDNVENRNGPQNSDSRLSVFCFINYAALGNVISPKYA